MTPDGACECNAFMAGECICGAWDEPRRLSSINLVREFHEAFGQACETSPVVNDCDLNVLRMDLLQEELDELGAALDDRDPVAALDALTDLQYVLDGAYLSLGFAHVKDAALAEVHRSNMSKLDADGKPVLRGDGKILKGPNYSPPDLAAVLRRARVTAFIDAADSEATGEWSPVRVSNVEEAASLVSRQGGARGPADKDWDSRSADLAKVDASGMGLAGPMRSTPSAGSTPAPDTSEQSRSNSPATNAGSAGEDFSAASASASSAPTLLDESVLPQSGEAGAALSGDESEVA